MGEGEDEDRRGVGAEDDGEDFFYGGAGCDYVVEEDNFFSVQEAVVILVNYESVCNVKFSFFNREMSLAFRVFTSYNDIGFDGNVQNFA